MPNLSVNLDIYNLYAVGEDPVQSLKRLYPWIHHVHLKNRTRSASDGKTDLPLAQGDMNYREFLLALADLNYGGYVSVEWFGKAPDQAAVREMTYLQGVLGDVLTVREDALEHA
jgi:3-dehydroshikimate dehydratase